MPTSVRLVDTFPMTVTGLVSPLAVPCNEPPYGTLHAIDLTTRNLLWSRPFGSARDTGPMNIPSRLPPPVDRPCRVRHSAMP